MSQEYVAYYRVSTQKQGRSGLGIEAQKQAVESFLHGAKPLAEFSDIAKSGKDNDRPELMKAMKFAVKHNARLLIAKLDRLSRNVAFVSAAMETGVKFTCCDMPEATEIHIHIIAAIAEYERNLISKRTKAALRAKMRNCADTGFTNKKGQHCKRLGPPNPEANMTPEDRARGPQVLRERALKNKVNKQATAFILKLQAQDKNYSEIARELNEAGFETVEGHQFRGDTVARLIRRHEQTEKIK